jgi:hypothetical protein
MPPQCPSRRVGLAAPLLPLACGLLLASVRAASAAAPAARVEDVYALARSFELQPLPAEPDWARSDQAPLLRFAWLSDFHLDGDERTPMIRQACHTVRDTIRPHFAMFTGDNCRYDPPVSAARAALPITHRRQLAFKDFLDAELSLPAVVLPGDNWPWDFDKVFGPARFSFDAAGLHLVCLAPDRRAKGAEGCAVFDPATWEWLTRDLEANRAKPTLVFMHENVAPPTFLDAASLERLLKAHPQVLGTLTGHVHLDLDFRRDGLAHILCPALAAGARPSFKVAALYPDRLVLNTWEYEPAAKRFQPTLRWQRIDIPEGSLRQGLRPVDTSQLLRENRSEMPTAPLIEDASLLQRRGELFLPLMQFLMQWGVQSLAP